MTDLKEAFGGKVKSTPLKEALKPKPIVEYTPDQVKLSELGIPLKFTKIYTNSWERRHKGKEKVFDPNNKSFINLSEEFWNYVLDSIFTVDLLKIDTSLLPEDLAEMTLKQVEIKGGKDDSQKQIKDLMDLIELLQDDNREILELFKWLLEFMEDDEKVEVKKTTKEDINMIKEIEVLLEK